MGNNQEYIFITGANGEVGHGLIQKLKVHDIKTKIIAVYHNVLDPVLSKNTDVVIKADVTDKKLISEIFNKYKITTIFHLAAILSTGGEKNPELAHDVNIGGTYNLLSIANKFATEEKRVIKFIFPSTIAVYGLPDLIVKAQNPKVKEGEFLNPITMYGINKLYCENLGTYFSSYYKLLSADYFRGVDFRCVRFPGLISADTIPTGGTSDYAPEMLHSAAQGKDYACFVRSDSTIHFMAMPDAINALLTITDVPKNKLKRSVYNISGFSASAKEIGEVINKHFPKAKITYKVDPARQRIVDSWSKDVDDSEAVKDWGWKAKYDFKKAFEEYLIPAIKRKYNIT